MAALKLHPSMKAVKRKTLLSSHTHAHYTHSRILYLHLYLYLYFLTTGLNEEWASLQTELSAAEAEMVATQLQLASALRDKEEAVASCEIKVRG